jgi:hypothetical protein
LRSRSRIGISTEIQIGDRDSGREKGSRSRIGIEIKDRESDLKMGVEIKDEDEKHGLASGSQDRSRIRIVIKDMERN